MENKNPTWSVNKTENKTQIWRRSKIPLVAIFIAGIILGAVVVQSQIPAQSLTISGGLYPSAATYTIFDDAGVCYAKSASGSIDYSGTNSSDIIQSAINAAGSGSVCITELITIGYELSIRTDGFTLYGFNMNSTGLIASAISFTGDAILNVSSGHEVNIHDLWFDGNADIETGAGGADYGIVGYSFSVQSLMIERVQVSYCGMNGILIDGCEVIHILDSIIVETHEDCVEFDWCSNIHLRGLEVGGAVEGNGFRFVECKEGQIVDCSSYWNGDATHYGYDAGNGYRIEYKSRGLVFTNCESEDNFYDGFLVYGSGTAAYRPSNISFTGCRSIRNGQNGVLATKGWAIYNATYVLISSCLAYDDCVTVTFPSPTVLQDAGISVWGTNNDYVMISNCMTFGNAVQGIEIVSGSHIQVYDSLNQTVYVESYP